MPASEDSVILPNVEIGRGAVIKRAVIDKRCRVPEGHEDGVDPAQDKSRFHVTPKKASPSSRRKMLGQSIHFV